MIHQDRSGSGSSSPLGPITRRHLETLWSLAPPKGFFSHFSHHITKLRVSFKLEALRSLLLVLEAQQFQHLHVVHASLHLPLDPESLEHHGPPSMVPSEPIREHVTHRGRVLWSGLVTYPFSFEPSFSFRPRNSNITLSKSQTLNCKVLVWISKLTLNGTRIRKVRGQRVPLGPLLPVLQSFLMVQEAQEVR